MALVFLDLKYVSLTMAGVAALNLLILLAVGVSGDYVVDDTGGVGRMFDGIGGLSGGGVCSLVIHCDLINFEINL